MKLRLFAAGVLVLAAAVACKDPLSIKADQSVTTSGLSAFALTGTPPSFPSALFTPGPQIVRPDGALQFDLAFDLDPITGKIVIIPVQLVGDKNLATRRVGLQRAGVAFADLKKAPSSGYVFDSTMVVSPGEAIAVIAPHGNANQICYLQLSSDIFSKIVVDSVNTASRLIYFKITVDPNCGFKSFEPGIPKN
jgi:hypothetical protein